MIFSIIKTKYFTAKKLLKALEWGATELKLSDPLKISIKLCTLKWLTESVEWKPPLETDVRCREIATYSDLEMRKGIMDDQISGKFVINLHYGLDFPEKCSAIFHELAHIRQQRQKKLTKALTKGQVIVMWNNRTFNGSYEQSPWEREAFHIEKVLIKKYGAIQHEILNKKRKRVNNGTFDDERKNRLYSDRKI